MPAFCAASASADAVEVQPDLLDRLRLFRRRGGPRHNSQRYGERQHATHADHPRPPNPLRLSADHTRAARERSRYVAVGIRARTEAVVVGAGICGLAAAYELSRARSSVLVLEAEGVGAGQSAGLARIFRIAHTDPGLCALALEARERWLGWERELGLHLLGDEGLVVAGGDAHAAAMDAAGAAWEPLSREEIRARLPGARVPWDAGIWDPLAGSLRIRRALAALAARLDVRRGTVEAVGEDGTVRVGGETLRAGAVLVCAGLGTQELVAPLGLDLELTVEPHVRVTYEGGEPSACLISPECYALPLGSTGRYAIGMHEPGTQATFVPEVFPALRPVGELECVSLTAPWLDGGDGFVALRAGRVLALGASNAMKFGPLIGDRLGAQRARAGRRSRGSQTVRSVTLKPREAALARMPWTVGPSSLQAPAHRRLTMPSALPDGDVDERSARVAPVDRAADVVGLGVVEAHHGLALLLRGRGRVVAEAVAGELDRVGGERLGRGRRAAREARVALHGRADAADVLRIDADEREVPGGRVRVADERDRAELDAVDVAHALADARDAVRGGTEVGRTAAHVDEVEGAGARVGLVIGAGLEGHGRRGARSESGGGQCSGQGEEKASLHGGLKRRGGEKLAGRANREAAPRRRCLDDLSCGR